MWMTSGNFMIWRRTRQMHNLYGEKGMEKVVAELKAELTRLQEEYDVPESLCK